MAKTATTDYAQGVSDTTRYYVEEPYRDVYESKFGNVLGLNDWDNLSGDERTAWSIFYASCAYWVIKHRKEEKKKKKEEK